MADGSGGPAPPEQRRRRRSGPPGQVAAAAVLLGIAAAVDAIWGVVLLVENGHVPAALHLGLRAGLVLVVAAVTGAAAATIRRGPGPGRPLAAVACVILAASGVIDLPEGLLPIVLAAVVAWLLFGAGPSREFFKSRVDA
jgi:hypothetical protein